MLLKKKLSISNMNTSLFFLTMPVNFITQSIKFPCMSLNSHCNTELCDKLKSS